MYDFMVEETEAEEDAAGVLAERLGEERRQHEAERSKLAERCVAQEERLRSLTDQLDASATAAEHGRDVTAQTMTRLLVILWCSLTDCLWFTGQTPALARAVSE